MFPDLSVCVAVMPAPEGSFFAASFQPVLVTHDAEVLVGEAVILAYLEREAIPAGAQAHRLKAEKARRRYLEEECECPPQPATR